MNFVDPRRLINHRRFVRSSGADVATGGGRPSSVRRIVLTGGPGSGKSTAAAFLAREFNDDIWVLPESATLLYKGGLPRATSDLGQQVAQRAIYTVQRSLEDAAALRHPGRVQLCDRATVDGAAYWPDGNDSFFRALGTTHAAELARYDAVVFMHTAALMPAGYERDMDVRTEDREEAIRLDRAVFGLYAEHPRIIAVESHESFLDKLIAVRNAVAVLLDDDGRTPAAQLVGLAGGSEPAVAAPLSSLMGLASVQHVLPVD